MSEISPEGSRARRSDAERNRAAILRAAGRVLARDPRASMQQIARAARTTRQTVYAHFPSRDALVAALVDRATARVTAALADADLDALPAGDALARLVEISWRTFGEEPFLLTLGAPPRTPDEERDAHQPVLGMLERIITRGRSAGDFDGTLPVGWMLAATLALGHAAGEEVGAGRMSADTARRVLRRTLDRLFAASA